MCDFLLLLGVTHDLMNVNIPKVREEAKRQAHADISASQKEREQMLQHSRRLERSVQAQAATLQSLEKQQQDQQATR